MTGIEGRALYPNGAAELLRAIQIYREALAWTGVRLPGMACTRRSHTRWSTSDRLNPQ
jgi:hypothetical protein